MASDEIVWQIINQQFCSFKLKTDKGQNFCRNEYNVTGLCSRQACPLANSRYATVRQHPTKQTLYLCMKTAERAHMPSKTWERIKLPRNYSAALDKLDERLAYWPKFLIHKCKQRLTRLTQVQTRMRRLAAEEERLGERLVPRLAPKVRHREQARERKAEAAARLERTIERELVEKLRQGAYGDNPLNVSEAIWKKVLNAMEREGQGARDEDMDQGIERDDEDEVEGLEAGDNGLRNVEAQQDDGEKMIQYVSDDDDSEQDDDDELDDWLDSEQEDEADDWGDDDDDDDDEEEEEEQETEKVGIKRKRAMVKASAGKRVRKPEPEKRPAEKLVKSLDW